MENYKKSTLATIWIVFAAAIVLSWIPNLLSYAGFHEISGYASIAINTTFMLVLAGMIAWGTISGKKAGINTLGRVGGWIYVSMLILVQIINVYNRLMWLNIEYTYDDSFWEFQDFSRILTWCSYSLSFIATAGLTLFAIGSKLSTLLKILIIIVEWTGYIISLCYMFVYEYSIISAISAIFENLSWILIIILTILWARKK